MTERRPALRLVHRDPPKIDGKNPPHDLDTEAVVLSAILLEQTRLAAVRGLLQAECFYSDAHRLVYATCCELADEGAKVDIATVGARLRRAGQLQRVGGPKYLGMLVDATPAVANALEHAEIVRLRWLQRRAIATCQRIASEGYGDVGDERAWLWHGAHELEAVAKASQRSVSVTVGESVDLALSAALATSNQRTIGHSTGLEELDEVTAGLHPGEWVVLTGDSKGGKTALAAQLLATTGKQGLGALMFSLEMPHQQISMRMACSEALVNFHAARLGRLNADDYSRLVGGAESVRHLPIRIDSKRPRTITEIRAIAERTLDDMARAGAPLRLVVIDYMQLVKCDDPAFERSTDEKRMGRVAELTARLAEELQVAVVGTGQTNDDGQIRDSRQLLFFAHAWWHIHNPFQKGTGPRGVHIEVKRQRHGPCPEDAPCWWHPAYTLFSDSERLG